MIPQIVIHNRTIGLSEPAFIIAEAGVNHNGDLNMARELVRRAKDCGADCVKFQTFKADSIVTPLSPKAKYQLQTTDAGESQLEMLKKLELSERDHTELIKLCDDLGIIFLSTPYSLEDIDFLDGLGVKAFKVASGQAVEPAFLEHMAAKKKPVILSTGMCTLAEVAAGLESVRSHGNEQVALLHCTTNYPSAVEDANLLAIKTMQNTFGVVVGYSDHTQSLTSAVVAVSLGAKIIERHFTLDKKMPGPDHSCSSEPEEFKEMVLRLREAERSLGSPFKSPTMVELENARGMRRSIVAKRDIREGETLTLENLAFKRPATGLAPSCLNVILGRKARADISEDTLLQIFMIS